MPLDDRPSERWHGLTMPSVLLRGGVSTALLGLSETHPGDACAEGVLRPVSPLSGAAAVAVADLCRVELT